MPKIEDHYRIAQSGKRRAFKTNNYRKSQVASGQVAEKTIKTVAK
jgi:hypothetical protein